MKKFLSKASKGFSLVEFIVIISIFAVMAGIGLFNFRGFQTNVSVSNLAHDLALTLHQAQVGGISGVSEDVGIPRPVGFQIDYDAPNSRYEKKFTLFQSSQPAVVDFYAPGFDTLLDTVNIQSDDFVSDIQVDTDGSGNWTSVGGNKIVVAFSRPFPEPTFLNYWNASAMRFVITNPTNTITKYVVVSKLGQISIK